MLDIVSDMMGAAGPDKSQDLTPLALILLMLERLMAKPRQDAELAVRPRIEPLGTF